MRRFILIIFLGSSLSVFSQSKSPVIVELFTSEGCSSCPPADQLLSSIVNESYENAEVIGLSFHVDYWNYIGWKDPYSRKAYTDRQRDYAIKFFNSTIYTPQMIVNGRHEFVGSNRSHWDKALSKELNSKGINVVIKAIEFRGDKISMVITTEHQKKAILNAALVERELIQEVTTGENSGRTLRHDNVVRDFIAKEINENDIYIELTIPQGLDRSKSSLVVYLQDVRSWHVIGAVKRDLSTR